MRMRSTIDWNEIVPKVEKGLRDALYLEAIMLLSGQPTPRAEPVLAAQIALGEKPRRIPPSQLLLRRWGELGDGNRLWHPARTFKILRDTKARANGGQTGKVWAKLKESKNDQIGVSGFSSICKGAGIDKGKWSAMACNLWSRGFIDTVPEEKKIGQAD